METSLFFVFILLQIGFSRLENVCEGKWGRSVTSKHWVVWIFHPTVLKGGHDFVIFIVAEAPKHFL